MSEKVKRSDAADETDTKSEADTKAHEAARRTPAGDIKVGDLVRRKAQPGEPPADTLYQVKDVSHDKGRLFASVAMYPDPSAGTIGSFHIEELELAKDAKEVKAGPGGHPPPTEAEEKAAAAHRAEVDRKAELAAKAEADRLAAERKAQHEAEQRKSRKVHE